MCVLKSHSCVLSLHSCLSKKNSEWNIALESVIFIRVKITLVCRNHTMRVKSHSACESHTLRVEINLVRVVITFVAVEITLLVKITLCVWYRTQEVSKLHSCVCGNYTLRAKSHSAGGMCTLVCCYHIRACKTHTACGY
jgi:hypothetical protein